VNSRPSTDNLVDFEDLVMFAINFASVSAPQAAAKPSAGPTGTAAASDLMALEAPAGVSTGGDVTVRLTLHGAGSIQAVSTTLSWNPAVVEPSGLAPGAYLAQQGGIALSAKPGSVDAALLGVRSGGMTGDGELATITFRVLAAGDPGFGLKSVKARDAANREVHVGTEVTRPAPQLPRVTSLSPAAPNPFREGTTLAFGLAQPGHVELTLFSVDGRRVRTLASGMYAAGNYRLAWDGRDEAGRLAAPGVYYARLDTAQGRFGSKVVLTR